MVEFPIQHRHRHYAKLLARRLGCLNNSITQGQGNVTGMVAEIVLAEIMQAHRANDYQYDLVLNNGKRIEVKTKLTSVVPQNHHECSVAEYNPTQNCDAYAFCRVHSSMRKMWFLGMVEPWRYYLLAHRLEAGHWDQSNGYTVKATCYNLPIGVVWKVYLDHVYPAIFRGAN